MLCEPTGEPADFAGSVSVLYRTGLSAKLTGRKRQKLDPSTICETEH